MKVVLELVTIVASDNEWIEGVLYKPGNSFPRGKTSLVLLHGAFGNFYTGVPRSLGPLLAGRGYPTLAINTRSHDYFMIDMQLEEENKDIQAAVNFLIKKGSSRVVLLGHSLGVSKVVLYQAETKDPSVSGLVLVSGNSSVTQWMEKVWGRETLEKYREMAAAEAAKDPLRIISLAEGEDRLGELEWYHPRMPAIVTRRTLTARAFLGFMGSDTKANAGKYMKKIKVPVLILHGTEDHLVPPSEAENLRKANPASKVIYLKASHYYKGAAESLAQAIIQWLKQMK